MTTCRLCKRECAQSSPFCGYHLAAKKNVESGYEEWSEAYGPITWKDYLRKLGQQADTGQWAKEVAKMLADEVAE